MDEGASGSTPTGGNVPLYVGLMSGMSRDGVDVALVAVADRGGDARTAEVLAGTTVPYDAALRARLARAVEGDLAEVATLHYELPALWARAVADVLAAAGVQAEDVAAIGSHGQTVFHRPRQDGHPAVTLQIGHGEALAVATGIPVVSDFRARDVIVGGEGAPLVPLADLLLFGDADEERACWNLGSIANVSVLPRVGPATARRAVLAFDTGPANTLIDAFARAVDPDAIDRDGEISARGRVDDDLLLDLWSRRAAWLRQAPPKSAGYATWGPALADELASAHPDVSLEDRVRTAVEATARMMRDAWEWHVRPGREELRRILLSGGGCRNPTLVSAIRDAFADLDLEVETVSPELIDLKEAVAFALLAHEALHDRPGNIPAATGAPRDMRLGTVHRP
ncbi:MAG: anhydro-N-acetylmuramic acid kinase [Planctomycetes bacterium]|nr:anhydro-N-acetylmuramic acid kinase [Planctomycetota bacterium]